MELPGLFAGETISIAATSAPKALPVVGNIIRLATDIRETSERVQINQIQSQQLSERIDTLIGFLAERDFSNENSESLHKALARFETFLLECLEFIDTFTETTWFKRVINNKDHEKKFLDLNRELTQYSNDITFGIGLTNISGKKQARDTRKEINADPKESAESEGHNRERHAIINNWETARVAPDIPRLAPEEAYVDPQSQQPTNSVFVSGVWNCMYYQYNQCFGPFQHNITFNHTTRKLSGYGEDNVGQYILNGKYSEETGQIEMIQQYQLGTGNPQMNLGHQGIIHLRWSKSKQLFKGTGYTNVNGQLVPDAVIEMSLAC